MGYKFTETLTVDVICDSCGSEAQYISHKNTRHEAQNIIRNNGWGILSVFPKIKRGDYLTPATICQDCLVHINQNRKEN